MPKEKSDAPEMRRCTRKDCIYRCRMHTETGYSYAYGCDYLYMTGKSRIAQHPPDRRDPADCTLYEKGRAG